MMLVGFLASVLGLVAAAAFVIAVCGAMNDSRNEYSGRLLMVAAVAGLLFWLITPAHARDVGQWDNSDPRVRSWYQGLMQPDNPAASCCGEADAYWCDDIHVRNSKTYCTITDDRDDAPLRRKHVDLGTVIEIPNHKLKWDSGNPTGHGVVFLSPGRYVYCYVQGDGT